MSGRKGQIRQPSTRERVAEVVRFKRECGFRWKEIARDLRLSERQLRRYMSAFSGYMSAKSGSEIGAADRA